jgi:hypothetical protein
MKGGAGRAALPLFKGGEGVDMHWIRISRTCILASPTDRWTGQSLHKETMATNSWNWRLVFEVLFTRSETVYLNFVYRPNRAIKPCFRLTTRSQMSSWLRAEELMSGCQPSRFVGRDAFNQFDNQLFERISSNQLCQPNKLVRGQRCANNNTVEVLRSLFANVKRAVSHRSLFAGTNTPGLMRVAWYSTGTKC